MKLVGDLLESASETSDSSIIFEREAKMMLRNLLERVERETERIFDSVEEFVCACEDLRNEDPGRVPSDVQPALGAEFSPWFQPYDDARRRVIGVQEVLTGDRLTVALSVLKEAPEGWKDFVTEYFMEPDGRKFLAERLTAGTLEHP